MISVWKATAIWLSTPERASDHMITQGFLSSRILFVRLSKEDLRVLGNQARFSLVWLGAVRTGTFLAPLGSDEGKASTVWFSRLSHRCTWSSITGFNARMHIHTNFTLIFGIIRYSVYMRMHVTSQ